MNQTELVTEACACYLIAFVCLFRPQRTPNQYLFSTDVFRP